GKGHWPWQRHTATSPAPDMARRIAHAKELLASYEKDKGKIDWSKIKLQCSTNIPVTCENAQIIQQLLKKINVNVTSCGDYSWLAVPPIIPLPVCAQAALARLASSQPSTSATV